VCAAAPRGTVEANRRRFDRWAPKYGEDRRSRWMGGLQEQAVAALELGPDDRVLDVGCGTGAAVRAAGRIARTAVGVDVSPRMIERAGAWPGTPGNAEFRVGEADRLPAEDGTFSGVLCTNAFHHCPDPEVAAGEMARVLERGGRVVIGDGCADIPAARVADWFLRRFERGHVRLYRPVELGAILRRAGFERLQIRRLWDGGYVFVRGVKA
jgi:ubiquinone/menaquinone biosynthesis C-methylase UbiE